MSSTDKVRAALFPHEESSESRPASCVRLHGAEGASTSRSARSEFVEKTGRGRSRSVVDAVVRSLISLLTNQRDVLEVAMHFDDFAQQAEFSRRRRDDVVARVFRM